MRRVVIESPLSADTEEGREENRVYARACCRESIMVYGEAPFSSHLLYDQPGLLHDSIPEERELGIAAGLSYIRDVDATIVYIDRGVSPGMERGMAAAYKAGRIIEKRKLGVIK